MWIGFSLFFFQAEDGIRDSSVTGVQTCALPIWCGQEVQQRRPILGREGLPPAWDVEAGMRREVGSLLPRGTQLRRIPGDEVGGFMASAALLSEDSASARG